jgi:hypothetical protein
VALPQSLLITETYQTNSQNVSPQAKQFVVFALQNGADGSADQGETRALPGAPIKKAPHEAGLQIDLILEEFT